MSDRLFPMPIQHLLNHTLHELDHKDSFFGIPAELFYEPGQKTASSKKNKLSSTLFNQELQTPIGWQPVHTARWHKTSLPPGCWEPVTSN